MKLKSTFICIVALLIAIATISGVMVHKYRNQTPLLEETYKNSNGIETTTQKPSADKVRLSSRLSVIAKTEISPEDLTSVDEEILLHLEQETEDGTLEEEKWHEITGYTLNAFVDKYCGGSSIDKGNNGLDYFTLGFGGDINFTHNGYVMTHARKMPNSVMDCIGQTFQEEMRGMDIMMLNNEFPYSDRGSPLKGKKYTFRSEPENVQYLTKLGVDLVSLANNHAYDYGYESFVDTISTLNDENIPFVGAGMNIKEASTPITFLINGYKVGYLACSGVEYPIKTKVAEEDSEGIMGSYDNGEGMAQAVREAKKTCDYVIVFPHWGYENTTTLTNAQKQNARKWIDAGADTVVGCHPHILQGMEFYNNSLIAYSLGNFWFNTRNVYTGILKLKVTPERIEPYFIPGKQAHSETHYLESQEERRSLYNDIISWSPGQGIEINDEGLISNKEL